jgi:bis(5'-nucleosidyl)-tetraphosphatase
MRSTFPSETEEGGERAAGFVLFRIFHQQRLYLLLQHRNGGHWGFAKGRLEAGEGDVAAASRETVEETSISDIVPVPGFSETSRYMVSRNGHRIPKTVVYFLAATTQSDVSLSSEHEAFRWLSYSDAVERLTYAESKRILACAEQRLAASSDECEVDVPQ